MPETVPDRLARVHPQMIGMRGEDDHKKLAVGRSVGRALELAGISQQQASGLMGYSDQGVVSRWCSGKERPHFDKLFELDGFEEAWIAARSESNTRIKAHMTFEIDWRKRA